MNRKLILTALALCATLATPALASEYFTPAGDQPVYGCRRPDVALILSTSGATMTIGESDYAWRLGDCYIAGSGQRLQMIREDGAMLLLQSDDPRLPPYWYARSDMRPGR